MGKTHRQEYTGGKAVDSRCRSGGSCRCHKEKTERRETPAVLAFNEYLAEAYDQSRTFTDAT